MSLKEQIKEIVKNELEMDEKIIEDDENLVETKLMDSISFIKIIVKLESIFNCEVDDDDLLLEKFSSVNKMVELISTYLSREGSSNENGKNRLSFS